MDDADGTRMDVTVELVSRLTASVGGSRLWRLLVSGDQTPSHLIVGPSYEEFPLPEQTGGTYRVENAVLVTSSVEDATDIGGSCPECGGGVRPGTVLDAVDESVRSGVEALDVPVPFMLADAITTMRCDGGTESSTPTDRGEPIRAPPGICTACGAVVPSTPEC